MPPHGDPPKQPLHGEENLTPSQTARARSMYERHIGILRLKDNLIQHRFAPCLVQLRIQARKEGREAALAPEPSDVADQVPAEEEDGDPKVAQRPRDPGSGSTETR